MMSVLQKTLDEFCDLINSPLGFYFFVSDDEKTLTLKGSSSPAQQDPGKSKKEKQFSATDAAVWEIACANAGR